MSEEIFALDIGTRKVMGIVARRSPDATFEVLEVEAIEHPARPMFDGQIHSIEEVAKTVKKVKENLERRLHRKLKKVGVAVAGRNLVTYKSRAARDFVLEKEITPEIVRDLELEAVDKIICDPEKNSVKFYCVGYSPLYYELDGHRLSSLIGHSAASISCEVIVTLLPRVVLDSMFAVLKKTGLEAVNITLEPISAIGAIVPPEMRQLNLILIDIGAGTADLALTKDGFVFAYGMVPEAGDEVTEHLSKILLTDFSTAERIKRSLEEKEKIAYLDIWGRRRRVNIAQVKQKLSIAVKKIAASIAQKALELNAGKPHAVVVVGGASLTYNLIQELSLSFGLSGSEIGIRLPQAIKNIKDSTGKLTGPEAITPIGILFLTADSFGLRFVEVEINQHKFKMLDFQQKKDILGALTLSGIINQKKLYPRPGLAISCHVKGELKIIKGTLGASAKILLNGEPVSSLSDKISDGDRLEFKEAVDGRDASCLVKDLIQPLPLSVIFNREILQIEPQVMMNQQEVSLEAQVVDRADIGLKPFKISDVLKFKGINLSELSERQILVNINAVPKVLTQRNFTVYLNGKAAGLESELKENDAIEFSLTTPAFYKIKDIVVLPQRSEKIHIDLDGRELEMDAALVEIRMNGQRVSPEEFLIDGADIKVYSLEERRVLLSEIFRYIEFDPQRSLGKRMKILVNDLPAGFTTPLADGAKIRILFEERGGK